MEGEVRSLGYRLEIWMGGLVLFGVVWDVCYVCCVCWGGAEERSEEVKKREREPYT